MMPPPDESSIAIRYNPIKTVMPQGSDTSPNDGSSWQRCALCQRLVPASLITRHHLKPRQKGGRPGDRRPFCRPCHKQLHATFSNTDLARLYGSIESLRNAPLLQPFLKWIRKQKGGRSFRTNLSWAHPKANSSNRRR